MRRLGGLLLICVCYVCCWSSAVEARQAIHFVTSISSDAIILESDGKFAMIDVGEDYFFPKGPLGADPSLRDFTLNPDASLVQRVDHTLARLQVKELEFILITHHHSDHLAGLPQVLTNNTVKKIYMNPYDESQLEDDTDHYDNQFVYDRALEAIEGSGVQLVSPLSSEDALLNLGQMRIQLFNYHYRDGAILDDNQHSIMALIQVGSKRLFLGGDIDNRAGLEDLYGPLIGSVDLMKLNHHGHDGQANSNAFLDFLHPQIAVKTTSTALNERIQEHLATLGTQVISAGRYDIDSVDFEISNNEIRNITFSPYYLVFRDDCYYLEDRAGYPLLKGLYKGDQNGVFYVEDSQTGRLARNQWQEVYGNWYYFDDNANAHRGWYYAAGEWYYLGRDGRLATEILLLDNVYYEFNELGQLVASHVL